MSETPPSSSYGYASVTVPSRVESIRAATEFLVQTARSMNVPPASDSLFEVAIAEALNNALEHGNESRSQDALIVCELELIGHRLTVRILGQGPKFVLPRPVRPEWSVDDLENIPERGFGISIIQGVFPTVRTMARGEEFGLEMTLTF